MGLLHVSRSLINKGAHVIVSSIFVCLAVTVLNLINAFDVIFALSVLKVAFSTSCVPPSVAECSDSEARLMALKLSQPDLLVSKVGKAVAAFSWAAAFLLPPGYKKANPINKTRAIFR